MHTSNLSLSLFVLGEFFRQTNLQVRWPEACFYGLESSGSRRQAIHRELSVMIYEAVRTTLLLQRKKKSANCIVTVIEPWCGVWFANTRSVLQVSCRSRRNDFVFETWTFTPHRHAICRLDCYTESRFSLYSFIALLFPPSALPSSVYCKAFNPASLFFLLLLLQMFLASSQILIEMFSLVWGGGAVRWAGIQRDSGWWGSSIDCT